MALIPVPQPYDFERSLDRFTFWGVDRANVWHDGGLHRVVDGREVRITPAEGGVRVEPLDEKVEPVVRKLLGLELDLPPFHAFAQGDPVLADAVRLMPGFRPPLAPDPFEALVSSITAQQVSLHSAFAVRSRFIDRFGVPVDARRRVPDPRTRRVGDRGGADRAGLLTEEGRVRPGDCARRSRLRRAGSASRRRGQSAPDAVARARRVERGLVPRAALARPEAWPAGDLALRKAVLALYPEVTDVRAAGVRFHPFQNLSAHYLLAALRHQ